MKFSTLLTVVVFLAFGVISTLAQEAVKEKFQACFRDPKCRPKLEEYKKCLISKCDAAFKESNDKRDKASIDKAKKCIADSKCVFPTPW